MTKDAQLPRRVVVLLLATMVFFAGQIVIAPVADASPPNDNRANALTISSVPFTHSQVVTDATREHDEPSSSCTSYDLTVWFRYSPSSDTGVMVDTHGSSSYTHLSVYSIDSNGNLSEVVCDKGPGPGRSSSNGEAYFGGRGGTTYLVKASIQSDCLFSCAQKSITLNLDSNPWPNDRFADATPIETFPFSSRIYNNAFTTEPDEPLPNCTTSALARTAWYKLTLSEDTGLILDTDGSFFRTIVAIYSGTTLTSLARKVCADNPRSYNASSVHLRLRPDTYYVQVASFDYCCTNTYGRLGLNLKRVPIPSNDDFAAAKGFTSLPFSDTIDTSVATTETSEPRSCKAPPSGNIYSVWYRLRLATDTTVRIDTTGAVSRGLAVFTGSGLNTLSTERCGYSALVFRPRAGTDYFIKIFGVSNETRDPYFGEMSLSVKEVAPAVGDMFAQAVDVPSIPFSHEGNLLNATAEALDGPDTMGGSDSTRSSTIWYRFTPTTESGVVVALEASEYIRLAIATGTAVETPKFLPETMLDYPSWTPTRFHARAGITYNLRLSATWEGLTSGKIKISLTPSTSWPNYIPSEASPLDFSSPQFAYNKSDTWNQVPVATCAVSQYPVWYRITAPSDTPILIGASGSQLPTVLSVYSGTPDDLRQVACGSGGRVSFEPKPGATYFVRQAAQPPYYVGNLKIVATQVPRPSNDEKLSATEVSSFPFLDSPDVTSANTDNLNVSCGPLRQSIWYSFRPASDQGVRASVIETGTSSFQPRIAVLEDDGNALQELGCSPKLSFRARKGKTYWLLVGGVGVAGSGERLAVSLESTGYPLNDDFVDSIPVSGSDWSDSRSTEAAGVEKGELPWCNSTARIPLTGGSYTVPGDSTFAWVGATIWYRVVVPLPGPVTITTRGSNFDTVTSVFVGDSVSSLQQLACNNNSLHYGNSGSLQFLAQPGTIYHVRIGGESGASGIAKVQFRVPAGVG